MAQTGPCPKRQCGPIIADIFPDPNPNSDTISASRGNISLRQCSRPGWTRVSVWLGLFCYASFSESAGFLWLFDRPDPCKVFPGFCAAWHVPLISR